MFLLKLSWANLLNKPLSTLLSLLLLTLGVGLISLLLLLNTQVQEKFTNNIRNIDMVVGAKGSPLQLILSSVYHIDYPTGNIALSEARQLLRNPLVKKAIPLAYGDSYEGYRIVGTLPSYVEHYKAEIATGKMWEKPFEVSVGNTVAQQKNLQVGDTFYSAHGLVENAIETHEHHPFKVVGIFKPSNSVLDQLILTPVESIWQVHDHDHEHAHDHDHEHAHDHDDDHDHEHEENGHTHGNKHEKGHDHKAIALAHKAEKTNTTPQKRKKMPLPELGEDDDSKSITALFVQFRSPLGMMTVPRKVNEDTNMQAAVPAIEVNRLFGLMGFGMNTLRGIAVVIMLIAAISVFISLYNSLKDRQYEMALMRSMGASPSTLFIMIVQESMLLSLIGFGLGLLLSRLGLGVLAGMLEESFHYSFNIWQFLPQEGLLFALTLVIGFVAALLPAIQASRTNISKTLAHA